MGVAPVWGSFGQGTSTSPRMHLERFQSTEQIGSNIGGGGGDNELTKDVTAGATTAWAMEWRRCAIITNRKAAAAAISKRKPAMR